MIDLILKQRLLKDKKYFDKWQDIMRPGPCEGQCGKTVPHRIMSHLGEKSTDDIYRGVISGTDKGSKNRLYHAMSAPNSYRYLCPTCDKTHEKNMFTENYNPVWNLDARTRGILAERAKKAQERERIKDLRKKQKRLRYMIKSLLAKSDNPWLDDKRNTRQLPPIKKPPIKKDISKEINTFIRKFETTNLPHEGTAKYKPQLDSRKRINDKLAPHAMSNRKQEVNPAYAPPMGFGAKTSPEEHIVPNYVPQDRTHAFKYRGKTYDASRMSPEEISDILAEMEQQI